MNIAEVLRQHEAELLRLPNVTGVGVGERDGEQVLIVFVREKVPASELAPGDVVPRHVAGVPTDVRPAVRVGVTER